MKPLGVYSETAGVLSDHGWSAKAKFKSIWKIEGFLTTKVRFDLMWHDMKNWECHLNLQPNVYLIAKQQIFINLNKGDLK